MSVNDHDVEVASHSQSDDVQAAADAVDDSHFYSAAALLAMQSAVIPTAIPSVRPSVRLSHAGTLSRRMNIGSRGLQYEVAKTL